MNSSHCCGFYGIKIAQKYAVFDRLKCENRYDFLHLDAAAVEGRRNWNAVLSYGHLPCNLLWNSDMEVRRK